MSDERQPNDVVDSQFESEIMPAEPVEVPAEPETQPDPEPVEPEVMATDPEPEVPVDPAPVVAAPPEATQAAAAQATVVDAGGNGAGPDAVDAAAAPENVAGDVVEPAPRVVSIADLETSGTKAGKDGTPALAGLASLLAGRGWIPAAAGAAVVVILLVLLFVPPISLARRIGNGGGYTVLDADTPSLEHPDGLTLTRAFVTEDKVRVKLGSTPRADFSPSTGPEELRPVAEAVPTYLAPKSPYYHIDVRAKDPIGGELKVLIPNESEPWETLDLYTWDAEAETWSWLPTELDRDAEMLIAQVAVLPGSVMVMQNMPAAPRVAAEVESWPVDATVDVLDEADVSGMLIGTMGGTTGALDALPPASAGGSAELVPTVRNWVPDRAANWALVSDMLNMETDREAHVTNLVSVAQTGGYPGLVVDYRLVQAQDRDLYAQFITDLGVAFDEAGLWLGVTVDAPQSNGGTWETGGYDWAALGAAADQLRFEMPLTPDAYKPGGSAEQLIRWAVTQVDRHKLMPVYSTLSTDGAQTVAMDAVLSSLGEVAVQQTLTESVMPGTQLSLSLGQVGVMEDPETRATSVVADGATYYLGTPQWLRTRLDLVTRYRLGGVVLNDLFHAGNMTGLVPAVVDFKADGAGTAASMPEVVWTVTHPTGQTTQTSAQITSPGFAWVAPTVTGTYELAATVAGVDKGSLQVNVSLPAPVITETVAEGEEGEEAGNADEDGAAEEVEVDETLKAAFVADVNVPDNTRFEKGEDFTKTWRLQNAGDMDWPAGTVFTFAGDTNLSESEEVEVGAVAAGENVDISVDMTAPDEDGTFKSTWELRADGKSIDGGAAYTQIIVGEPVEESPADDAAAEAPADAPVTQPVVSAPVAAGSFELGGHVRDYGLPYKDKMRYAGMTWIKTQVFYGQDANGMIAAAHNNGFKIQLSAIGGADMVTQADFESKYAAWVGQMAAAGADAIEVWNEPNIDREWKIGHISPASYTSLLCASYNAIKTANPGTAVISAAPAPTGWFGGCGPNGCDDQPWLEGMYNAGATQCMDYIGAHHNAGATSPSARVGHPANPGDTHHSWFFLPQTELYYNIFRGARQLFYTEMGYASQEGVPTFSDQFAWARGTNNSQQAAWLAEAVQLSINTGMVRSIVVWNIDFVRYGYDPQDGFAIIRPGGGCPACETLHNVLGSR